MYVSFLAYICITIIRIKKMKYLQLDQGKGSFFEYSGSEKEGFEEFKSTKGNVSYRKYYHKGVDGVLDSVNLFDGKFGKQIQVAIKAEDDTHMLQIDLYDQKDNVSNFAEELIKFIPSLSKGDNIEFNSYNFIPEGEQYPRRGFSIKKDGEKVPRALSNAYYKKEDGTLVEGDIPAIKWVKKLDKNRPSLASLEEKNDYLLDVIVKETERLKFVPNSEYAKAESNKEVAKKDVDDELPF